MRIIASLIILLLATGCSRLDSDTGPAESTVISIRPTSEFNPQLKHEVFALEGASELRLVFIKGGTFNMGRTEDDSSKDTYDLPPEEVSVHDFYMGVFEITENQFAAVMELPHASKYSHRALNHVSWLEASAFCEILTEKTGWTFSLPSEAQWEYACRAGGSEIFGAGISELELENYAWFAGNHPTNVEHGRPRVVGTRRPNQWGLYDMHGNVFEWCQDKWRDPQEDNSENAYTRMRVIKGGAWRTGTGTVRCAHRYYHPQDISSSKLGFRVVAVPPRDHQGQ